MRALSRSEYAVLKNPDGCFHLASLEGANILDICLALQTRGCMTRTVMSNDAVRFDITDLGLLALRVSRPEMAFRWTP